MNGFFDRTSVMPVILSLGVSLILSFCLTPLVKWLAVKIGAVDVPKGWRFLLDLWLPCCCSRT